jgi:hypothetical protein
VFTIVTIVTKNNDGRLVVRIRPGTFIEQFVFLVEGRCPTFVYIQRTFFVAVFVFVDVFEVLCNGGCDWLND